MVRSSWVGLGVWIFLVVGTSVHAMDLGDICAGSKARSSETPGLKLLSDLIVIDQGFCREFELTRSTEINSGGWKIRFYASHQFTHYFNSDIVFHSSRYSVEIKDYEWAERGSREFFKPSEWFKPGNNPAQMLDEPTNTYTVSLEKDGHEFFLSIFHPKFYQNPDQVKPMSGTIDGVAVNDTQAVNEPFHGYEFRPGESKLVRNQFTNGQMIYEMGYGHRFTLFQSKIGNITYIPQVGVGIQMGHAYSVMVQEGKWWDFEDSSTSIGFQGMGGSVSNRIEFNSKSEKVGVFYENRMAYYHLKDQFFDGTQKFNLGFVGNSVGVKFVLYHRKDKAMSR